MFRSFNYKTPEPRPEDLENHRIADKIVQAASVDQVLKEAN